MKGCFSLIFKNKGLFLETIINNSIEENFKHRLLIQKLPLSNALISVENNIIKAKLRENIFCDYCGLYKGQYLEFEAKETELDYFPLKNIPQKQVQKLTTITQLGGIGFIVIYFHTVDQYFGITINEVNAWKNKKIPLDWFISSGIEIKFTRLNLNIYQYLNHLTNYT